jgi:CRP-like cAMP-binding protein
MQLASLMIDKNTHTDGAAITGTAEPQLAAEAARLGLEPGVTAALGPAIDQARLVSYPPGSTLYNEGTGIEALYVVRRGIIKLLRYVGDGSARIVRLHNRASIIGLNGLLGEAHDHTAIAVDEVQVYQLPLVLLMPLRDNDPAAYSCLIEQWGHYLNSADTWISEFSSGPIRSRVARLLRFLVEFDSETGSEELKLLTGVEMAEVLGVTPESVSRVIADFKRCEILRPLEGAGQMEHYRCNLEALEHESHK